MGANMSHSVFNVGGPMMGAGNVVEVPLREKSGNSLCELPRAEVPHDASDCPAPLAQILPPSEFAQFMSQLNHVVDQSGLTFNAARRIQQRMSVVSLLFFVVFVIAIISWQTNMRSCMSSRYNDNCSTLNPAVIVYMVAIIAFGVAVGTGSCYARKVLLREQQAVLALRQEVMRLSPMLAARGVMADIGENIEVGGGRRVRVFKVQYSIRFALPPGVGMPMMPPVGMTAVGMPMQGGFAPYMMGPNGPIPVAAAYHPSGAPLQQQYVGQQIPMAMPYGYAQPMPQQQQQQQGMQPMGYYQGYQPQAQAAGVPPGVAAAQHQAQAQQPPPYYGGAGGGGGGGKETS